MSSATRGVHTPQTSYEEMVAVIKQTVEDYNSTLGEGERIDFDKLMARVRELGGTDAGSLGLITEQDLVECDLPRLRARQACSTLQRMSSTEEPDSPGRNPVTEDNAGSATVEELVWAYDPRVPNSPAARRIAELVKYKRCIVFDLDDGGGIHRKLTAQVVQELIDGEPERETFLIRNRHQPLFRVGEQPPRFADEHPLFAKRQLYKDGACNLLLNWRDGISKPVRILFHLASQRTGEILVRDNDHVRSLHEIAKRETEEQIRDRYPRASVLYDELCTADDLPTLKVKLEGTGRPAKHRNDPFHRA